LIRHAGRRVTLPVGTLPVAMIEPALRTLLVAAVGSAALPAARFAATSRAAIALSAVAVRTNPEHRLASLAATNSLPEKYFSVNRHPPTQADFDSGNGSCQGRNSFDGGLLMKVANPEPRWLPTAGFSTAHQSHHTVFRGNVLMPGIDGYRPFGADDVAGALYNRQRFRRLRFLMTGNTDRRACSRWCWLCAQGKAACRRTCASAL